MFQPEHALNFPAISLKLSFMQDGEEFAGTGFVVEHEGRNWLFTCRHIIENRASNFTGKTDLTSLVIVGHCDIEFDGERSVVGVSVDGFITDCAAVELRPNEWSNGPRFGSDIILSSEGATPPTSVTLSARSPQTGTVVLPISGWVFVQGFVAGEREPTTLQGVRAAFIPKKIRPWMVAFLPGIVPGFSGGPVLDVRETSAALLGIATHRDPKAKFTVPAGEGKLAEIEIPASIALPIKPLIWALDYAQKGDCIVPVPLPGANS